MLKYLKYLPFYLLSLLPLWLLYWIADGLYWIVFYLVGYRKKVVTDNIQGSFPEKSAAEIEALVKGFYHHFCEQMIESIKVLSVSRSEAKRRLKISNLTEIEALFAEKRDVILYAGHHGNWEWISFLPLFFNYQLTAFYQPLSNKYFDGLMLLIRQRFGLICVPSAQGYKALVDFKRKGILTMNLLLSDQSPGKKAPKQWVPFLHRDTAFLLGADRIAKKTNQVLVFPSFKKPQRGTYELEFQVMEFNPESSSSEAIVLEYARTLEKTIIAAPELWLWSHRRWKLKKD